MPNLNLKKIAYRWRVRAGSLGLVLAIILAKPDPTSFLTGLAVCLLGLLIRTWSAGHLRKEKELSISGPYQYTRNPLYLGNFVIGIGVVFASRSWWVLGYFAVYFLFFYSLAIKKEMERMKELFPDEYDEYKKKAPLFFPTWKPFSPSEKNKFSWELFRKNKEWRALTGAVLFWLILALKIIIL
jgi:protein-S-isoprenylcysteine O-methyltransferase Ste14